METKEIPEKDYLEEDSGALTLAEKRANTIYGRLGLVDGKLKSKLRSLLVDILDEEIEDYRKVIRESIYGTDSYIGINAVIEYVCERYMITPETMQSKTRKREIMECRQIIHWMIRRGVCFNNMSLEAIGKTVGGKDHATVMHSIKQVDNLIETNAAFRERIMVMCNELGARTTWIASDSKLLITGYLKKKEDVKS